MRVIAGEFGRRKLIAPKGETTRPTPDRLRESLFSILMPTLEGGHFYDLYAGSGAVGIEAISRGAARATFVEKDRDALVALRANIETLGLRARAEVIAKPVERVLEQVGTGIVFVDPPYEAEAEYLNCLGQLTQKRRELILMQHDRRLELPEHAGLFVMKRQLKQGDNRVSFYFFEGTEGTP